MPGFDIKTVNNIDLERGSSSDGLLIKKVFGMVLLLAMELVFLNPSFDVFLGPLLTILFCYFYFVQKEKVFTVFAIVIANDALGTIFQGSVSFVYLLMVFMIYEMFSRSSIKTRILCISAAALTFVFYHVVTEVTIFRTGLFTAIYTLSIVQQFQASEKEEFIEKMATAVSLVVALISIHALITGGVEFAQMVGEEQRYGVLGVGIGDPNFSALILCAGISCSLNHPKYNFAVKLLLFAIIVGAIIVTLSITGIILLVLVLALSSFVNNKPHKSIIITVALVVTIVATFQYYVELPSEKRNPAVDSYIERVEEKIGFFEKGDISAATTNRSDITKEFVGYIKNDISWVKQWFGGNKITRGAIGVSHNSYIDFVLQFGFVGLIIILAYLFVRLKKIFCMKKDFVRKNILILKILYIVAIFTLSVYNGSTFAMMFNMLFLL